MHVLTNLIWIGLFVAINEVRAQESIEVKEGERFTIPCEFSKTVKKFFPFPSWVRSNQHGEQTVINKLFSSEIDYRVGFPSITSHDLHILKAKYERDNGKFECQLKNFWGKVGYRQSHTVIVLKSPGPPIISPNGNLTVTEGKTINLHCSSSGGNPPPIIKWFSVSHKEITNLVSKNTISDLVTRAEIELIPSKINDGAVYKCTVWNKAMAKETQLESEVTLNVNYPPLVKILSKNTWEAEFGNSIILKCVVDSKPKVKSVTWTKNGIVLSTKFIFAIRNVTFQDAGDYICIADNGLGKAEIKHTIDIQYAPRVTIEKTNDKYEIQEGNKVYLKCTVDSNPAPFTVEWLKEGDSDFRKFGNVLHIDGVRDTSAGTYICRAINSMNVTLTGEDIKGIGNDSVRLFVRHRPGQPKISPNNGAVIEGVDVSFTCTANPPGWPLLKYRWCRESNLKTEDKDTVNPVGTRCHLVDHQDTIGTIPSAVLKLKPSKKDDGSIYKCVVWNEAMPEGTLLETMIKLDVTYPPEIRTQSKNAWTVEIGKSITLECIVDAKPKVKSVTWIRNGNIISTDLIFTINNVNLQDSGDYICTADNGLGKAEAKHTLDVLYSPKVSIEGELTTYDILEGKRISIKCIVKANPVPFAVEWLKKDEPDFKQSGQVLTIDKVSFNSTGTYICRAINAMNGVLNGEVTKGIGNDSISLFVHHKPGQPRISPKNGTVIEGVEVTFTCTADPPGWPPSLYRWCREYNTMLTNRHLVNSERTNECLQIDHQYVNNTLPSAVIKLKPSKEDDGAVYRCGVWNQVMPTILETKVELDVNYPPKIQIQYNTAWTVEIGRSIKLECIVSAHPKVDSVKWIRNGEIIATSFTHIINNVTLNDLGDYFCSVDDGSGKPTVVKHELDIQT